MCLLIFNELIATFFLTDALVHSPLHPFKDHPALSSFFRPKGNWQDDPEGGDEGAVGLSRQRTVGEPA